MANHDNGFKLWFYTPSLPAAVIMTIIFSCLTIFHTWRLIRCRTWFCIPLAVGGLFEIIGYVARAASHNNMHSLMPYILQALFLLLAPPLFAASIYMVLGRIINATRAENESIIRVSRITKIFVCSDIFCFFIQSSGGSIQSIGSERTFKLGEKIVLGGLILQIIVFECFLIVAGIFHARLRKRPTPESLDKQLRWERLMWVLYVVSILIAARNLIRCVEFGMGFTGYLFTHEWVLYVFDGLLMAITLLICTAWYQVDLRPRPRSLESYGIEQHAVQPKICV